MASVNSDTRTSVLALASGTLRRMDRETPAQKQARIDRDLEALRIFAWCVQRNRYSAEPVRIDGGRRGKARIGTFTFYLEAADIAEAREAVREIRLSKRSAGL